MGVIYLANQIYKCFEISTFLFSAVVHLFNKMPRIGIDLGTVWFSNNLLSTRSSLCHYLYACALIPQDNDSEMKAVFTIDAMVYSYTLTIRDVFLTWRDSFLLHIIPRYKSQDIYLMTVTNHVWVSPWNKLFDYRSVDCHQVARPNSCHSWFLFR